MLGRISGSVTVSSARLHRMVENISDISPLPPPCCCGGRATRSTGYSKLPQITTGGVSLSLFRCAGRQLLGSAALCARIAGHRSDAR